MFGFLKKKLKDVMGKFSEKVEKEAPEEEVQVEKEVKVEPPKKPEKAPKKEKPEVEKPAKKPKARPGEKAKPKVKESAMAEKPKVEKAKKPEIKEEPKIEKEVEKPEVKEEQKVEKPEKKGFFAKVRERFVGKEEVKPEEPEVEAKEEPKAEEKPEKPKVEERPEKKGFFKRITETITTKRISAEKFDEMFWDLELALLENNVAVEVIEKIKDDLKGELVDKPIPRSKVEETIAHSLHDSIEGLFSVPPFDIVQRAKEKKPFVICFVGVNGSGKTTSIAKVAKFLQSQGLGVVLAAADTFRAAAIDQLQLHADKLGVKLIRHDYGADPAAVAFDAVKHAESTKKDVVLIDTAGRLHSNINLMDEMRKIVRVASPDVKIFVGESITGNDCVEQAKKFDEAVGIDGIILAKADVDEKGGAAISVSYVTKKPILFLGVGQEYADLQPFDKERLLASIGL